MTTGTPTYHALQVSAEKCIGCTHCMRTCPTEAIRIRNGLAIINQERCVDCGRCLRVCPEKAIFVEQDDLNKLRDFKYRVILFPAVMIGQFREEYTEDQIYDALLKIGFTHIFEVEQPINFLKESIRDYVDKHRDIKPCISTFCPSVVRMIQIRYPSLVDNLIQLHTPQELGAQFALEELKSQGAKKEEIGLFYVTPCIAKMSAVKSPMAEKESIVDGIINMNELYNLVRKNIRTKDVPDTSNQRQHLTREGILWSLTRGEAKHFGKRSMAIDGIHNVVKFLERLENENVPELDFLEVRACDKSCAGGNLLSGNRFLTTERLESRAKRYPFSRLLMQQPIQELASTLKPKLVAKPVEAKPVFILDKNREKALEKMSKMHRIVCMLPGIDCGACGAPNCHALAEDMACQQAKMSDCIFLQQTWQESNKISASKALQNMERKWGKDRFKADCNKRGRRNEGF